VAAIGFELYVELLGEAVAELTGTRRAVTRPVRVDAQIDAYVPAGYVPAEAQRIDLHRRLALAESEDELRELHAATQDRFGPLPEPVEHLFAIQDVKLKLARIGADYLVSRGGRAVVGPLVLGSAELRELRLALDTAVYSAGAREITLRGDGFERAVELVDAILELRLSG
jgi:transcription-repair coupling factor (superfamily II helicase)